MFSRTPNTMNMVPKRFEASLKDYSKSKNLHTAQKMKNFNKSQNQQKRAMGTSKDYYHTHGPNCGYLLVVGISGYLLMGRIGG